MRKLLTFLLLLITFAVHSQTRNLVPNSPHTGNIGTKQHGLYWLNLYSDSLNGKLVISYRLLNDHDSLLHLQEKNYSSLDGKPTLGTASAQDVGYFDAAGVNHTEAGAHVTTHENSYTHANIATTYGWGDHAQAGYLLKTDTASMLTKYLRKLNSTLTGLTTIAALKVTTGAGAGKALLSDADGDLSYSAAAIGASAYHADNFFEAALGNPGTTGWVLSSTDAGIRSWIAASAGTVTGTGTTNELSYWTSSTTLGTLAVATYPSLTEVSYVKGVTSAIQTQIGNKSNTASPTFTGVVTAPAITLPTNGQVTFTIPTTNGHCTGPVTSDFVSGYSNSAIGDLVYLDADFKWQKADKGTSVATYSGNLGIALEVKAADNALKVALPGSYIYCTAFPTLTSGPVYMDDAGAIIEAQPTTADHAIRIIGYGVHGDKLYFFPSPDYIIHL